MEVEKGITNKMFEMFFIVFKYSLLLGVLLYFFLPYSITRGIYYPSKQLFDVDISYEDIFIPVEGNVKINAWHSPPTLREITVVFCHGNGGNLSFYTEIIRLLQENGYGVMAIDYRGYGKSTGRPDETGLVNDLRAAIRYLKENKNTPEQNIVLWGFSLGGGVAAHMAAENDTFRGVILQSTFTTLRDMASYVVHRIYLGLKKDYESYFTHFLIKELILLKQEYRTKDRIKHIKSPLLLAHAMPDNIVPFEMTVQLADENPKARVFISQDGGHNEHSWFYPKLFEFLNSLCRAELRS